MEMAYQSRSLKTSSEGKPGVPWYHRTRALEQSSELPSGVVSQDYGARAF